MGERIFTADVVVMAQGHLLLIERRKEPYAGMWALPGGKYDPMRDRGGIGQTACRELREETGIQTDACTLRCLGVFDALGRDPRGTHISTAFLLHLGEMPQIQAGDDAANAQWFPASDLPDLAFDHDEIVMRAFMEVMW